MDNSRGVILLVLVTKRKRSDFRRAEILFHLHHERSVTRALMGGVDLGM